MRNNHKNQPFKVPEGYFDQFNANLKGKLSTLDTVFEVKSSFKIPEGYIENFNSDKILVKSKKRSKVIWLFSSSVAASLILMFSLLWKFNTAVYEPDMSFEDSYITWIESNTDNFFDIEILDNSNIENIDIYDNIQINNSDIEVYFEVENFDPIDMSL